MWEAVLAGIIGHVELTSHICLTTAMTIYKTIILLVFDYCHFQLVNNNNYDAELLQKLLNCAFRTILHVECLTPTHLTHNTLQMDTLIERRYKHTAVQVYKTLNDLAPAGCVNMYEDTYEILTLTLLDKLKTGNSSSQNESYSWQKRSQIHGTNNLERNPIRNYNICLSR